MVEVRLQSRLVAGQQGWTESVCAEGASPKQSASEAQPEDQGSSSAGLVPVMGFILWMLFTLMLLAQQPGAGW